MHTWTSSGGSIQLVSGRPDSPRASVASEVDAVVARLWDAARSAAAAGNDDDALRSLQRAVDLRPGDVTLLNELGSALYRAHRRDEALAVFGRARSVAPGDIRVLNNLGNLRRIVGDFPSALEMMRDALSRAPDNAVVLANLAATLLDAGRPGEALAYLDRAAEAAPGAGFVHGGFGNVLRELGRPVEAIEHFERAVEAAPGDRELRSSLLYTLNFAEGSPESIHAAHLAWGERFARRCGEPIAARDPGVGPVRVGFVSSDFRRHPVAFLLAPLLRSLDRDRFDTVCYSDVISPDSHTERVRSLAGCWRETSALDDRALARLIRSDAVDVLVDLAGHTAGNRLLTFAERAAPVQATWMYMNTTGLSQMDFLLTDERAVPADLPQRFVEQVVRMPGACLAYDMTAAPPIPERSGDRDEITFGCFNRLGKLGDPVIEVWGALLGSVPEARLELRGLALDDPGAQARILATLGRHGVAPERVRFAGAASHGDFLRSMSAVDVALDPFPFSGVTTTLETLWMGVPVVTRCGDTYAGRASASFLLALGLDDCVAVTADDYVSRAAALVRDRARLAMLRESLRERVRHSVLGDGAAFARNWGNAVIGMVESIRARSG